MPASYHPTPASTPPSPAPLSPEDSSSLDYRGASYPAAVCELAWEDGSAVFALRALLDGDSGDVLADGAPHRPEADRHSETARLPDDYHSIPPANDSGSLLPPFDTELGPEALPEHAALSSGDVGQVFCAYRSYVAKIARRILGTSSEVDDLIQDVFLTTLKDIHKVKDPARLRAWLATVTTRMAKRRRFRSSIRPTLNHDDPEELFEQVTDEVPSPESTADLAGNIERVLSLPDELRTPWMLKHVEGRTLQDVAAQCDCSLSTAARRIQAATGRIQRR